MPYLGIFAIGLYNIIVIFEIYTLEFVKNEFLTQTVNLSTTPPSVKVPSQLFLKFQVRVRFPVRFTNMPLDLSVSDVFAVVIEILRYPFSETLKRKLFFY